MSKPGPRPVVGDLIWLVDICTVHGTPSEHICTVQDTLSEMLRATYEVARADGGWTERTLFAFYRDCEWDIREQRWIGKAG